MLRDSLFYMIILVPPLVNLGLLWLSIIKRRHRTALLYFLVLYIYLSVIIPINIGLIYLCDDRLGNSPLQMVLVVLSFRLLEIIACRKLLIFCWKASNYY